MDPGWIRSVWQPKSEGPSPPGFVRDRVAMLMALVCFASLCFVYFLSNGQSFLMPGQLTSAHGGIEACSTCHTQSGSGKLSWVHGVVAGDPRADSKACMSCHKMPDTAFNAHGASAEVLKLSTGRLEKVAVATPQPPSARMQSTAFPTHGMEASGLTCATCHQEHKGSNFKLSTISNEQCQSCHVARFDSFDGNHPKFESYPFKRRTRIVYDHAGHFGKHYPEVAKKDPAKRIPATCSTCHNSNDDRRIMSVAPFEKTCASCHLDQIVSKERVSGPKGVAFLSLPGLDLDSLKKKTASIGEWPDASEAALTPFMKVMISRTARGRALLKTIEGLNLQDLASANDDQIKAVTNLAWETKALFHEMILGKAADVLGNINIGGGAKLSAGLVADLTASIPRDVLVSAQQQWLPKLVAEMANRKVTGDQDQDGWVAVTPEPSVAAPVSELTPAGNADVKSNAATSKAEEDTNAQSSESSSAAQKEPKSNTSETGDAASNDGARAPVKFDPPACAVRVLGQCLMLKDQGAKPEPADAKPESGKAASSANTLPPAMRAGLSDLGSAEEAHPERPGGDQLKPIQLAAGQSQGTSQAQTDDLLFPTEDEQREIRARDKGAAKASQPDGATAKNGMGTDAAPQAGVSATPQTQDAPVISIDSDVDPESWAEYGGWYRQDFAIFYRPTGHKDKFIYTWLFLTGPQAPKNSASPAAAVFNFLTSKDAQGSCTKCHSVDALQDGGRLVNFAPPTPATKQGRFTNFIHEPHFSMKDDRGCLTCHNLQKSSAYLKTYEQSDPHVFEASFGAVKKDLCQSCHTSNKARQNCLTCHKYHVNGVNTPIMSTKNQAQ